MFSRLAQFLCLLAVLTYLAGSTAWAQSGQISGQVTDQQSLVIPGASVTVVNLANQEKKATTTGDSGAYSVTGLPPGKYQVVVEASGFSSSTSKDLTLTAGQSLVFNVTLAIAIGTTEVTVQAGPNQIELDNPALSGTLTQKEVTSFGLNGRNFTQLLALTPGVSNQTGQDEAKVGVAGSAKFSVNGGRVEYNTFEVDGSDTLNTSINASRGQAQPLVVYPSIDAIQEIKVLTSNYGAEYGKSGSGSVLVTTKSGTKDFHGNAYEFIRNEFFNARNYFDQTKHAPLYRRNDFGGTFGGPVFIPHVYDTNKDKTFFFFSEEFRFEKTPVDYNQGVPSLQERQGNFSDVCPVNASGASTEFALVSYPDCPATTSNPGTSPFVKAFSAIGQQQPSPVSAALLATNVIPLPTSTTGCNSSLPASELRCYNASVSPSTFYREELFRIDHNITPSETLSFRFVHDAWNTTTLTPQWGLVVNSFPTVQNKLNGPGLDVAVSLQQVLPKNFLNRIVFAYSAAHISLVTEAAKGVDLSRTDAGIDAPCQSVSVPVVNPAAGYPTTTTGDLCPVGYLFPSATQKNLIPGLEFNGTNPAYGGHGFAVDTGYAPWDDANPTYMVRDDLSKTFGKHTIQVGAQLITAQENESSGVNGANTGDTQGLMSWSNQLSVRTTNNAFADFIGGTTGVPSATAQAGALDATNLQAFAQDSGQARYHNRYHSLEFYGQDDWRITPRLTLNLGFRGSLFGTWYNDKNTAYNWEPGAFNQSTAHSVFVNPENFWLNYTATGNPVPLDPANLDPSLVNGLVRCGVNGVPKSCMASSVFHPGPRVGFAWDPFGKGTTSMRGGYGIFWEHGTSAEANTGSLIGGAPLILSVTAPTGNSIGYYNCIGGGALNGQLGPNGECTTYTGWTETASGQTLPAAYPLSIASIPTKAVYSYIQQWSLSVEHEIKKNLVFTVAYAGTKGTHLTAEYNLNQLRPLDPINNPFQPGEPLTTANCGANNGISYPSTSSQGLELANPSQAFYDNLGVACYGNIGFGQKAGIGGIQPGTIRPYLGFNQIFAIRNVAASQYHALQSTLHQTAGPLDLGVSYTYSHSIDDASDRFNSNFVNAYNLSANKASSDFDERHLLNISYIYDFSFRKIFQSVSTFDANDPTNELPVGMPQKRWYDSQVAKVFLDGWQLSGITMWLTGTPFSAVNGGGSDGTGPQDNAGVGYGLNAGSYPDIARGVPRNTKPPGGRNAQSFGPQLLDPAQFVAPQGLTYGNAGRNFLNNPSRTNFNTALLKHFKVLGENDLEFRAEAFNVFNHTQFRIYDPSHPGNTGNNVISCYGGPAVNYSAAGGDGADCLTGNSFLHPVDAHDPRIMQFGLKLTY